MKSYPLRKEITLGIAGLGAIGMGVARAVDQGEVPGMRLVAVSANDIDRAQKRVAEFSASSAIIRFIH